ncbi:MAG: hypothetical protein WDO18_18055 [Acidobacteriota bacterium]
MNPGRGLLGPNTAVSWKVSKVEVAKSGDLGYLYGVYSLAMTDPKGGAWKCIVDTYHSDVPISTDLKK